MLKRHEIQVLLKAGHSRAEVAQLTGVSLRSVKRVAKEGAITQVDDAAAREARGIGRPSLVEDFRKPIVALLDQERDLKSVEVLRRMRLVGYTGFDLDLAALRNSQRHYAQNAPAIGTLAIRRKGNLGGKLIGGLHHQRRRARMGLPVYS